ncbi:hypothetical protein MPSEU_000026600 [Mayamaea pseudoterrestris]|nr:hypothetical protein MPSEU_000026600 [Mayamaea pseudoterrestris]
MSSMLRPPHAGQRRFHDYPKLRDLYQQRLYSSSLLSLPKGLASRNVYSSLAPSNMFSIHYHQTRSLHNPFSKALKDMQLKRLEKEAIQNPTDVSAQSRFLTELAQAYPQAFMSQVGSKANAQFALDASTAALYLQMLQQTNQVNQLDVDLMLSRLENTASHGGLGMLSPDVIHDFRKELAAQKMSKKEQLSAIMNFLASSGGASMTTGMLGAAGGANASRMMMGSSFGGGAMGGPMLGLDPKRPLQVQVVPAGAAGIRGAVIGFVAKAALLLVAFSAVGALLDERGLGRGMGLNSNSKHVQEAEHEGRKVKFDDVKGVAEAKAELEEIVMYLKDPSRFTRLGGRLPRGVLLTGPPGTGKTLLAKAIAGEADVPFFYASGSQFEEVYVGLGAKRVRELFEAAKKKGGAAIIFIDELDAVGGTRKLKDQSALKMTLNELLVQMDGFNENNGIIVIGATNFMESLDDALLRPGRFDKHVSVPLPDVGGRKEILELYCKKTKLDKSVDINVLARGTTGFSGADLFNLINQAALKASVDGLNCLTMEVLEYAKDKIIMGAERKSAVITPETAKCTAYHEAGHALVAVMTEGAQPIHKATIMPRGQALGMVTTLPDGDQTSQSKKQMIAFMDMAMGGRVAEELVFGSDNITSGAMSDIQSATRVARNMVTKCGYSDAVGVVFHGGAAGEESASEHTRDLIDAEVKRLTDAAYKRAKEILQKHSKEHQLLAETLLEYETLTGDEVRDVVLKRQKPKRPVINKEQGQRGDQGVIGGKKGAPVKPKTRIPGMSMDRGE